MKVDIIKKRTEIAEASSHFLRSYAYKNGQSIYGFMDKYDIGTSAYGKLMDAAAYGKGVVAHRLYGHHLIYDFPIKNPKYIDDFLQHIFSDLFTKQGIPILPGELFKKLKAIKSVDKLVNSWNFVNGFDLLAGTIAIYSSIGYLHKAFSGDLSIDNFKTFSKLIGLTLTETLLAFSTANPFLLIAAMMQLTATTTALFNDNTSFYLEKYQNGLYVCVYENILSVKEDHLMIMKTIENEDSDEENIILNLEPERTINSIWAEIDNINPFEDEISCLIKRIESY